MAKLIVGLEGSAENLADDIVLIKTNFDQHRLWVQLVPEPLMGTRAVFHLDADTSVINEAKNIIEQVSLHSKLTFL